MFLPDEKGMGAVTAPQNREMPLGDNQARHRALLKASSEVLYRMSPDWRVMTQLNSCCFLAETKNPSASWLDEYIPAQDQPQVVAVIREAIRSKNVYELEHRVYRADGTLGWTYSRAVPIMNEANEIVEWFGAASDITQRKNAEKELRELSGRLAAEVETLSILHQINSRTIRQADTSGVYNEILQAAISLTNADCGTMQMASEDGKMLEIVAHKGLGEKFVSHFFRVCEGRCVCGKAFEERTRVIVESVLESKIFDGSENRQVLLDEGICHIQSTPMFSTTGNMLGILTTHYKSPHQFNERELRAIDMLSHHAADIIGQAKCEAALRQSEEKYRFLFQSIDEGFAIAQMEFDPQGKPVDYVILEINDAYEKHSGLCSQRVLGRRVSEFLGSVEPIWLKRYGNVVVSREPQRFEEYGVATGRWYSIYAFPMTAENCFGIIFSDITGRKSDEERKTYLLKLSDALRHLSDATVIKDTAARFMVEQLGVPQSSYNEYTENYCIIQSEKVNGDVPRLSGAYKLSDFSAGVDILQAGRELIVPDVCAFTGFPSEQQARYLALQVHAFITIPLIKENRLVASFSVRNTSARHWTPEEVALVRETAERTWSAVERAKAEEALRQSEAQALALVNELEETDRNKNQFLSSLSHELRNPLAIILTGLSVLGVTENKADFQDKLAIIQRQTGHLCHLVDDLLDLTRISAQKARLLLTTVELNDIVCAAGKDHMPLFKKRGVQLVIQVCCASIYIDADARRITQCIANLLNNALKFSQEDSFVHLALYEEQEEAVICVKDNGIGIDPEFLPVMFEPFKQADQSLTRGNNGLGLGLYIVKGLVELHGGSVSAASEGIGKGAAFYIRLPKTVQDIDESMFPEENSQSVKILVFDSN